MSSPKIYQVANLQSSLSDRVLKAGDTMTGNLNVAATLITQNVIPDANVTYDLGTSTARFKDLWLSNSTIYLGEASISAQGGNVSFGNAEIQLSNVSTKLNVTNDLFVSGNVGIGTASASAKLSVDGSVVFNESGADVDFRIEGDNDANLFFVDASTDRIGVGTNAPAGKFDVNGTSNNVGLGIRGSHSASDNGIFISPASAITGSYAAINSIPSATTGVSYTFGNSNNADATAHSRVDAYVGGGSAGDPKYTFTVSGVINWCLGVDNSDSDKFKISASDSPGSSDFLTIDSSGNLGVGTNTPSAKLQVNQNTNTATAISVVSSSTSTTITSDYASLSLKNTNTTNNNYNTIGFVNDEGDFSSGIHGIYTSHTAGSQSGAIAFATRNAGTYLEKMRLDASGNLLVNTTNTANFENGFRVKPAGSGTGCLTEAYNDGGGTALIVGRGGSDGTALDFRRGSTQCGAMQVSTSSMTFTSIGSIPLIFGTNNTERARIDSSGTLLVGKTSSALATVGAYMAAAGEGVFTVSDNPCLYANRRVSDGTLVNFYQAEALEGTISVSGATVSYNAFAGSHWSQLQDGSKPDILRGTVMESINELCVWPDETNERLPKCKISDTAGSKKVYGVFMAWDNDWTETNDMYVTAVGAFVCRVNADVTVQEGDLLESNGDGTARVQADDLIRSSTIGKVTSTVKTHEYDDGSYCVPTVLYCG